MKTCQNCKTRSKDDAIECIHCGTPFGAEASTPQGAGESAVKQTLFGIPAQKLEDLLAAKEQTSEEDISKKTMAGFNISGLFGDEAKAETTPPAEEIPSQIQPSDPKSTMAGFNVSELFVDAEKEKAPVDEVPKEVAPDEPKFGTMMGINVADIMSSAEKPLKVNASAPSKTLFSLPAVESPAVAGQAPARPTGRKGNTETAAGGVQAAIQNDLADDTPFKSRAPSKVSLGSLLPKVDLQKKDKVPRIAARPSFETPVEFEAPVEEKKPQIKSGAAGIIRKSKPASSKGEDPKRSSGVVGSYVVGKESLNSESSIPLGAAREVEKPVPLSMEATPRPDDFNQVPVATPTDVAPEIVPEKIAPKESFQAGQSYVEIAQEGQKPEQEIQPLPKSLNPTAAPLPIAKEKEAKKESKNLEGSIKTIQFIFVISAALIILSTIGMVFLKDQGSLINAIFMALSLVGMLGSLGVLFASKNDVVKGSVWTLAALLLFASGVIGFFLGTPLMVLFVFAGALFLFSALFPKIVSIL